MTESSSPAWFSDRVHKNCEIVTPTEHVSAPLFRGQKQAWSESLVGLSGKSVVVHGGALHFLQWLLLLDGTADTIVLVPHDACERLRGRVMSVIAPDFAIIDSSISVDSWAGVNVLQRTLHTEAFELDTGTTAGNSPVETKWVLATSGTTSTPKLVSHTFESLARTVAINQRSESACWGLLYDPARFAGLQVCLQAMVGGGKLLLPDTNLEQSKQVDWLAEHGCSELSATPTLWRKILMHPSATRLPLRQITLGGEIADAKVLKSLDASFPTAHITHIYASTEVGVGFAVHDRQSGFPAKWLNSGVSGFSLRVGAKGTMEARRDGAKQEYLGLEESIFEKDGWIDSGDLLEIDGDRVYFKGRLNGSISIGGNKVFPEEVESVICELSEVSAALVRGKSNSVMGSLIEALIVPSIELDDAAALKKLIKSHCRGRLASYKCPVNIKFVEQLPSSASGKLLRGNGIV